MTTGHRGAMPAGSLAVGLVLALGLTACAGSAGGGGGEGPELPGDALGPDAELCYRFVDNEASRALDLPWGVALQGGPVPALADSGDRRAAATLSADGTRSDMPFGAWRPLAGDSVQVDPVLTGRLQLRLAAGPDALRGVGRPVGDVAGPWAGDGPGAVEGVVAEPAACPAPA